MPFVCGTSLGASGLRESWNRLTPSAALRAVLDLGEARLRFDPLRRPPGGTSPTGGRNWGGGGIGEGSSCREYCAHWSGRACLRDAAVSSSSIC